MRCSAGLGTDGARPQRGPAAQRERAEPGSHPGSHDPRAHRLKGIHRMVFVTVLLPIICTASHLCAPRCPAIKCNQRARLALRARSRGPRRGARTAE